MGVGRAEDGVTLADTPGAEVGCTALCGALGTSLLADCGMDMFSIAMFWFQFGCVHWVVGSCGPRGTRLLVAALPPLQQPQALRCGSTKVARARKWRSSAADGRSCHHSGEMRAVCRNRGECIPSAISVSRRGAGSLSDTGQCKRAKVNPTCLEVVCAGELLRPRCSA